MSEGTRTFKNGLFVSTALPAIAIRLPVAFAYLGATTFVLEESASVDRHHFVAAGADGALRRLVIFHFEHFLPGVDRTISYRLPDPADQAGPNYRYTPTPVRLGEHDYLHNTWFFDAAVDVATYPQRELGQTARLLAEHGHTLPDALQMSRYVRILDTARTSELILFYMEPLDATGFALDDFVAGGPGAAAYDDLSAALTARSARVFSIEQG